MTSNVFCTISRQTLSIKHVINLIIESITLGTWEILELKYLKRNMTFQEQNVINAF